MNHLPQGNTKATNEKHIANLFAENFAQVSSTKNYSNQFNSIRIKEEKNNKIHLIILRVITNPSP